MGVDPRNDLDSGSMILRMHAVSIQVHAANAKNTHIKNSLHAYMGITINAKKTRAMMMENAIWFMHNEIAVFTLTVNVRSWSEAMAKR